MSSEMDNQTGEQDTSPATGDLHGLLVTFEDDQLNECIKATFKQKTRVRFNCMDTFSGLLAFGSSSGAIYLYKFTQFNHSSCDLISMIPCEQGSIEAIKFLPNLRDDDLLVAIGTTRGSIVVFRFPPYEQTLSRTETIYKEKLSTHEDFGIKFIDADKPFTKLYICDERNRLYVLDIDTIYSVGKWFVNQRPSKLYAVEDSNINQISINGSQLLISTDETTRFFNELDQNPEALIIGKKPRKKGYYGACFFNPDYRPVDSMQQVVNQKSGTSSEYSSTTSINESEKLLIFVSRPLFRLWQVDHLLNVKCTHQFKPLINNFPLPNVVNLRHKPLEQDERDDPRQVMDCFSKTSVQQRKVKGDHFQRIIQIHILPHGNLLLTHTQHDLFVIKVDANPPGGAELIACYSQEMPIVQVCCNENEIFIWSAETNKSKSGINEESTGRSYFEFKRLLLLTPYQLVLELHRTHRTVTLMMFVQHFCNLFRRRMALPLSGPEKQHETLTQESGMLRNLLVAAWESKSRGLDEIEEEEEKFEQIKNLVEEIVSEKRNFKRSLDNLNDSAFLMNLTPENLDRICCEPITSLLLLEVSLKDLHTNRIVRFNEDATNRHKSMGNLFQSLQKLKSCADLTAKSTYDLKTNLDDNRIKSDVSKTPRDKEVVVERRRPKRFHKSTRELGNDKGDTGRVLERPESLASLMLEESYTTDGTNNDTANLDHFLSNGTEDDIKKQAIEEVKVEETDRCKSCRWPGPRSHLKHLNSSQQIQLNWIEANLVKNFEENLDQIKERSLKHGLWLIFLKCLAYSDELDDYITCCMMLDDVRLLEVENHVITRHKEEKVVECLLKHLNRRAELTLSSNKLTCLKCNNELEMSNDKITSEEEGNSQEDELSFTLVNLFEQFMLRPNADAKRFIDCLLNHRELLNVSKIPAKFYLKVIAFATLIANQSPISRRLNQLRSSSASSFLQD